VKQAVGFAVREAHRTCPCVQLGKEKVWGAGSFWEWRCRHFPKLLNSTPDCDHGDCQNPLHAALDDIVMELQK